jgi:TolB-like protein
MEVSMKRVLLSLIFILTVSGYLVSQDEVTKDKKESAAVFEFENLGVTENLADLVTEFLREDLSNSQFYTVLGKKRMQELIAEKNFRKYGCTSAECVVEIGKILNVKKVFTGSIGKQDQNYFITIRLIDVESGEVLKSEKGQCDNKGNLEEVRRQMVEKILKVDKIITPVVNNSKPAIKNDKPVNAVKEIPYLGVIGNVFPLDKKMVALYNVKMGFTVVDTEPGSLADKVGFNKGDIIVKFCEEAFDDFESLTGKFYAKNVGDPVSFLVIRNEKEIYINLKLKAKQGN